MSTRTQGRRETPDDALCQAVKEMQNGLIDADLGGFLLTLDFHTTVEFVIHTQLTHAHLPVWPCRGPDSQ